MRSTPNSIITDSNEAENSRFAVFLLILVGNEIELKLKDGKLYRGIFQSLDTKDNEVFICIQYCARIFNIFSDERSIPIEQYKIFPLQSVSRFFTTNVNGILTSFEENSHEKNNVPKSLKLFKTDIEIGKEHGIINERVLQPWVSEEHNDEIIGDILGETPLTNWDQFEENRIKFGVEGTYDETLYTTPLDYNNIPEEDRKKAEILAREIERDQKRDHIYFVENDVDGLNMVDEEMHFSSVYRETGDKDATSDFNNTEERCIGAPPENNLNCIKESNKTSSKTNFSFNPNAKEFLPRYSIKPNIICPNNCSNYSDDNVIKAAEYPLFTNYQNNEFNQCVEDEQETSPFQQKQRLYGTGKQYSINNSSKTSVICQNEGDQFGNCGEFLIDTETDQHIQNTGYFVYSEPNPGEYNSFRAPRDYSTLNHSSNNIIHNEAYYFQGKNLSSQHYYYQVTRDSENWSNEYPIQDLYLNERSQSTHNLFNYRD